MSEFAQFISYGGSAAKRERILKQKRARYAADAEHRAAKQEAAKNRYRPVKEPSGRKRGRNSDRAFALPDGSLIVLVSLGTLADFCGLSKQVISRYEKRGVIPLNRLVDSARRRWYPKLFAEWLAPLLRGQSELREPLWSLKARVEQAWANDTTIPLLETAS